MKVMMLGIFFMSGLIGCAKENIPFNLAAQPKYILLEYIQETYTEHRGGVVPFINITPAGNYKFDENTKTLEILSGSNLPQKNKHFKLILGIKQRITGDIASSERGRIIPIERFPYEFTGDSDEIFGETKPLTIVNVDKSGNVFLKYNDKDIEVKFNSEMNIREKPKIKDSLGTKIRFTVNYTVKNHGVCKKENIILQKEGGDITI